MKYLVLILSLVFTGIVQPAHAGVKVVCKSKTIIEGWTGGATEDYLIFTAEVISNYLLDKASIEGAYLAGAEDINGGTLLTAISNYVPQNPRYRGFNKFPAMEDAWFYFNALLPQELLSQTGTFAGYMQIFNENGSFLKTVDLNCELK